MQAFFKKPKSVPPTALKTETSAENISHSSSSNGSVGSARWSRKQEKEQLSGLNDRLAHYIERVRNLESENACLHVQIQEVEELERREREISISRSEAKIAELRKELDLISHEKTKLEMERNKEFGLRNEYELENAKLTKKLEEADKQLAYMAGELERSKAMINNAIAAKNNAEKENKNLKADLVDYKSKYNALHEKIANEVLLRRDLQNQLKTRQEDLDHIKKNHNEEMNQIRKTRHVEISSFTAEVENRYKDKLHDQLKQMRADFDSRISENRAEIDELYRNKLAEASENAARNRDLATQAREEMVRHRMKVNELEGLLSGHNETLENLTKRIKELENLLKQEKELHNYRVNQRDERIRSLENEVTNMMNEYQDLMDTKIQLDTELLAYQKLLEGEENRLRLNVSRQSNTSNNSFPGVLQPTIRRAIKRRRLGRFSLGQFFNTTRKIACSGDSTDVIEIGEIDAEGKFVKIVNNGDSIKSIGSWTLVWTGGKMEVSFKFRNSQTIEAHEAIAVWSNNMPIEEFDGVVNIQMKNQVWPAANAVRVDLLNCEKETIAWKQCIDEGEEDDQ